MNFQYDIIVIGAGPGGYETAIRAAQLGKKTCIVEKTYFGGTCLNVGCIPTKTLLKSANLFAELKDSARFAVMGAPKEGFSVDLPRLKARKDQVVRQLTGGVQYLLKGNGVDILNGAASFVDPHTLQVGEQRITGRDIIIATGSEPSMPGFIAREGINRLLTSTEALDLEALPESMTIIGGGVIGIEFAYLFHKLGVKVSVLELIDHILPMVDTEVSELVKRRMAKDGVKFELGARVELIRDNTVYYQLNGEARSIAADAVLMAVGRTPHTEGLNAEGIGLAFNGRAITADSGLRTNIDHIYAIGDVNGKAMLAHVASHEGLTALENICGGSAEMNYDRIPSCIYLDPEVACIGLTEIQARARCANLKIGRFRMAGNGKSLVEGDTDGLFKVLLDGGSGKILGVHLYGKHTTEMISEISVAMEADLTAEEVLWAIHPHPTVSEALGEAFMSAWRGRCVNSL